MSNTLTTIRIHKEDKLKIMEECKKDFLKHHPEFKGMKLSYPFMVGKIVHYYLNN